jgi:hypothetical protein
LRQWSTPHLGHHDRHAESPKLAEADIHSGQSQRTRVTAAIQARRDAAEALVSILPNAVNAEGRTAASTGRGVVHSPKVHAAAIIRAACVKSPVCDSFNAIVVSACARDRGLSMSAAIRCASSSCPRPGQRTREAGQRLRPGPGVVDVGGDPLGLPGDPLRLRPGRGVVYVGGDPLRVVELPRPGQRVQASPDQV